MITSALATVRDEWRSVAVPDDLLRALVDVLDIRVVFPRVSQIAATVLPHDRLTLTFHGPDGEVVLQAASDGAGPARGGLRLVQRQRVEDDPGAVIGDLRTEACSITDPPDFKGRVLSAGDRSALEVRLKGVPARTDLQALERDVIVRVLADCVGNKSKAAARLGISRTQLCVRLRKHRLSEDGVSR
jgi:regulatory Fis family protein